MNLSAVIQQLVAFRQIYGDLPVYQVMNGIYMPVIQAPWLANPVGMFLGPANYVVVFGSPPSPVPVI